MARALCYSLARDRAGRPRCCAAGPWCGARQMLEQALGRVLAVVALFGVIGVLVVIGAIFLECASWGQCPEITQVFSKSTQEPSGAGH